MAGTIKRNPCREQRGQSTRTITKEQEFKKIYKEIERNECGEKKEKEKNQKENRQKVRMADMHQ